MISRTRLSGLLVAPWLTLLLLSAPGASGQDTLTISPSEAEGIATPGTRTGPFEITNSTDTSYEMEVFPVLVGQNSDGALLVRQAPEDLRVAARSLRVIGDRSFDLKAGDSRSVMAKLISAVPDGGFYGGVLFQGTPPAESGGAQVTQVLQLNARVYLEPPADAQRPQFELTDLRVEQNGSRRLQALLGFHNTGNTVLLPSAGLAVRDDDGDIRFKGRMDGLGVIPGASVDIPVDLGGRVLEAGSYRVEAKVRSEGRTRRIARPFELFGPNEVATEAAEVVGFDPPQAEEGAETEITVRYENTGNVDLTPRAELVVGGLGEPVALETSSSTPGELGSATGSVHLKGVSSRQLTVRLLADGRELDKSSVTVTPTPSRPLSERTSDWLTENALLLMALLLGLVFALTIAFAVVLRRRAARS